LYGQDTFLARFLIGTPAATLQAIPSSLSFQYPIGSIGPLPPQQLSVSSVGGSIPFTVFPLRYRYRRIRSAELGFASPSSGIATSVASSIIVNVATGLQAGSYSGTITMLASTYDIQCHYGEYTTSWST